MLSGSGRLEKPSCRLGIRSLRSGAVWLPMEQEGALKLERRPVGGSTALPLMLPPGVQACSVRHGAKYCCQGEGFCWRNDRRGRDRRKEEAIPLLLFQPSDFPSCS